MTDNEIISCLRKQADYNCDCCPIYCDNEECGDCPVNLARHSLDLIDKQRTEIDRLNDLFNKAEIIIRPEAIEEFKDRLKTRIDKIIFKYGHYCESEEIDKLVEDIDSIAKEMIGDTYEHN